MADTHINAFFAAVDTAKAEVIAAKGKLQAAQEALETKKKQDGYVEPAQVEEPTEPETQDPTVTATVFNKKNR